MPKTYLEMTKEEIAQKKRLTPKEQAAVDAFLAAAKALPRSICIEVDTFGEAPHLVVQKRITDGSAVSVGELTKSSLCF